jgi:hypothetical protein
MPGTGIVFQNVSGFNGFAVKQVLLGLLATITRSGARRTHLKEG